MVAAPGLSVGLQSSHSRLRYEIIETLTKWDPSELIALLAHQACLVWNSYASPVTHALKLKIEGKHHAGLLGATVAKLKWFWP